MCKRCDSCQRNESRNKSSTRPLQPLPLPHASCTDISMEFIIGLSPRRNRDAIMVVVYGPPKWLISSRQALISTLKNLLRFLRSNSSIAWSSQNYCLWSRPQGYLDFLDSSLYNSWNFAQILLDQLPWKYWVCLQKLRFGDNEVLSVWAGLFLCSSNSFWYAHGSMQLQKLKHIRASTRTETAIRLNSMLEILSCWVLTSFKLLSGPRMLTNCKVLVLVLYKVTQRIGHVAFRLELPPVLKELHDVFYVGLLTAYSDVPPEQPVPLYWKEGEGCF